MRKIQVLSKALSPDVTIVTIGPLSTFAEFIKNYPADVKNKVHNVVSMGGFISRKNHNFVKEYNFGCDSAATITVLNQKFQHFCVTKNVCSKVHMFPKDLTSIQLKQSPARQFAFSFMKEWFGARSSKKLHDPFTLCCAVSPNNIKVKLTEFEISREGGCRGTMINSGKRYATIGGTPVSIDWFFDMLYRDP